ncbi:autotransporter outer membrane beta-barrel domain-containing protein, partial [Neorhizobium sp. T786]|uniref:autotransporter outer membrane beta-barrel domain-containing protein n=1 Tax=Pseudorhizobium xiangyangii TaxID=2883104 RepID=UPI001CFFAA32
ELRAEEMSNGFHAWSRAIGKSGSYSPKVTGYNSQGFSTNVAGMQIGGDYSTEGVFVQGDKLTVGLFGEFAHSSFDVSGRTAHGSISSKGIGGYATWQQHAPTGSQSGTGLYVDAVVKHDWLDFGVDAKSVTGFDLNNGYKGRAISASVETGYGIDLGDNLILQPQAQLVYSKVTADSFTDNYGVTVSGQESESLRGRLGLRLEKTFFLDDEVEAVAPPETRNTGKGVKNTKGKASARAPQQPRKKKSGRSVTTFVDANVKHELRGKGGFTANGTSVGSDMGGTTFDVGIGATAKLSDNVSLYGRASVEFGGHT